MFGFTQALVGDVALAQSRVANCKLGCLPNVTNRLAQAGGVLFTLANTLRLRFQPSNPRSENVLQAAASLVPLQPLIHDTSPLRMCQPSHRFRPARLCVRERSL